jgi:hypothetical protein
LGYIGYVRFFPDENSYAPFVIRVIEPPGSLNPILYTSEGRGFPREDLIVFKTEEEAWKDSLDRIKKAA